MENNYLVILSNNSHVESCEDIRKWREYPGTYIVKANSIKRAKELRDVNKSCFLIVKVVDSNFNLVDF